MGIAFHEDYETPGIQAGLRLEVTHARLEAYWVRKDYPALGFNLTIKTGKVPGD